MTRGRYTPTPVTIRGVAYPSIVAAAKALGVSHQAIHQGLRKGNVDSVGLTKLENQGGENG